MKETHNLSVGFNNEPIHNITRHPVVWPYVYLNQAFTAILIVFIMLLAVAMLDSCAAPRAEDDRVA